MDGKKIAIWVVVAAAVVAAGFLLFRPASGGGGVQNVTAQEMEQLVSDGVRVIDVRTDGEYAAGRIPGAENVPVNQIEAASAGWNKDEPIAIYCATGARSANVVSYLEQQGFATIYHFNAGIVAWEGRIEQGAVASVPTASAQEETATQAESPETPVMYEFYTDT